MPGCGSQILTSRRRSLDPEEEQHVDGAGLTLSTVRRRVVLDTASSTFDFGDRVSSYERREGRFTKEPWRRRQKGASDSSSTAMELGAAKGGNGHNDLGLRFGGSDYLPRCDNTSCSKRNHRDGDSRRGSGAVLFTDDGTVSDRAIFW
ncbi:hypothetical protein PIB30_086598 [Stylosanthes scabra]|uniref:Uncharacterized protein n=1 Tax=Stylosanthes scabra TaxID=79078 RepID=A0ABU6TVG9_9FABA|nr:hypothetical protein [Stylosanthes scabra]